MDAEQLREHVLFVQAYEVDDDDEVIFAGEVVWVCERAPMARRSR